MTLSSKRAEHLAWASFIISALFFIVTWLIGRWSGFGAISATAWLILSAVLIWSVLVVLFHQRALAEQEKLDISHLAGTDDASTIFQTKGAEVALFAVAQRRLEILEKWFLPIFSALVAVYQIGIGLYLLSSYAADVESKQPLVCAVSMTAIAFVSFLMSRYATGMSAQVQWKPLRAGGSFLLAIALVCFAMAISMALAHFNFFAFVNTIARVIAILLIILGLETALNVVFDIYRPRVADQYARSAFDSRLLGVINEPGGIFRTAASAIDYQFGFEVSQTWFYKLLEKAIVPLVLFAAAVLYLLSSLVIVAPNEHAIIERLGDPVNKVGETRIVGSGLSFKLPWPIDIAYKYPTEKISEIYIGFVPKMDPETGEPEHGHALLWGKAHHAEEYKLLVASLPTDIESDEDAVPVGLVIAAVQVQYKIRDLYSFIYNHKDPKQQLESICYRELTRLAANATVEADDESDMKQSLLGAGRTQAKRLLTERIQAAADKAELGVEIVCVGLQGIHPPLEIAADYQAVIGAIQTKQATILKAEADSNKILSTLAGSVENAERLTELAAAYQKAEQQGNLEELEKLGIELDSAFTQAKGEIFITLRQAQSYAFEKAALAEATGQRFAGQLQAYAAAGNIYKRQQRLAALEEGLKNVRKYVIVTDVNDRLIFELDVTEKLTPSLYELGGFEENP